MKKPSPAILRGLQDVFVFLEAHVDAWSESELFESKSEQEQQRILDAIMWIGNLAFSNEKDQGGS